MAEQKIYEMTVEGIRKLQEELELRKIDRRTEIAERIRQARSFGDLSENSEYDDAKNSQAENEARIMELETVLKNARAIEDDDISKTRVTVGSVVTLRNEEFKEEETYTLVGPKEEDILSAIVNALLEDGRREFDFWGLRADSPSLALLPQVARSRGLEVRIEDEAVCPSLDLPPTWEDYLELLGKKNRHELRRKMRRLEKTAGPMRFRVLCSPLELEQGMDDFLRLMTLKSDKAQFMTPQMERFFRHIGVAMAEEGLAGLYMFELDGRRVASTFCFEDKGETLIYNSGYDPQYAYLSVGLLSKAACLRHAIEDGRSRLDFLRGNEPYKYDLGGKDLRVHRCLIKKA